MMNNLFSGRTKSYIGFDDEGDEDTTIQSMARVHFTNLENGILDYYGADAGDNTFKVDSIVFKVLEDPDDGYRSHLGAIDYSDKHDSIFFGTPIARVRIEVYDESNGDEGWGSQLNQGYRLVDVEDDHVWLEFGTHNYDDYYPCFVFRHYPKVPGGQHESR